MAVKRAPKRAALLTDALALRWLIDHRGQAESLVCAAIRDAINAHGPLTRESAPSAAKRVIGVLKGLVRGAKRDAKRRAGTAAAFAGWDELGGEG